MAWNVLFALVLVFCLALSFFLSGMEAGVFTLSRLRIRQWQREGDPRARLLLGYLEHPENFLWTILVGNMLAYFIAVGLVVAGLHYWVAGNDVAFWGVLGLFLFGAYAVGDLLPKLLFQAIPNRLCLWLAPPFRLIHLGLSPLVSLVTWISRLLLRWTGGRTFTGRLFGNRDELVQLMQESAKGFSSEERAMISRALDLQTVRIGQIMVPLEKAVTITTDTAVTEIFTLCRQHRLSRLPVWHQGGSRRRIVGLVSLKTLLYRTDVRPEHTAGHYVKPAMYLNETVTLEDALRRMQRSGQRLAVVLGHDRREVGLVSLQDVLRFIFGEVSL